LNACAASAIPCSAFCLATSTASVISRIRSDRAGQAGRGRPRRGKRRTAVARVASSTVQLLGRTAARAACARMPWDSADRPRRFQ
jgi:hypothetical protein